MEDQKIYKQTLNNKQIMKNKMIKLTMAVAAMVAIGASVEATPITGGIALSGSYTPNGTPSDLTTATSVAITGPFFIDGTSGSFVGAGAPITFVSTVTVNPTILNPLNLVGVQLWSVLVGTTTYTFDVTSESESVDTANQLTLVGNGTFEDGTLADATSGTFQLGFGVTQTTFSFQNNNQVTVPDGGTTAMLLGVGLSGLALLKRKLVA